MSPTMKYLRLFIIIAALSFVVCSCNRNEDTPFDDINLPIAGDYVPTTVTFDINDSEWKDKIKEWTDKDIIVNSISELPDDPLGFSDAYKNINFNKYTLIITYNIHAWTIDTYRNRYFRDIEGFYNWSICIKTASVSDIESEQLFFTRYSILVDKLPRDKEVKIWFSLGSLNWDWSK